MQRIDDDSGGEEQERFEEGMGHEMKDGGRPCAHAQSQKHIADLAHGGIRQHAFEIPLRERAEARQ